MITPSSSPPHLLLPSFPVVVSIGVLVAFVLIGCRVVCSVSVSPSHSRITEMAAIVRSELYEMIDSINCVCNRIPESPSASISFRPPIVPRRHLPLVLSSPVTYLLRQRPLPTLSKRSPQRLLLRPMYPLLSCSHHAAKECWPAIIFPTHISRLRNIALKEAAIYLFDAVALVPCCDQQRDESMGLNWSPHPSFISISGTMSFIGLESAMPLRRLRTEIYHRRAFVTVVHILHLDHHASECDSYRASDSTLKTPPTHTRPTAHSPAVAATMVPAD